MDRNSFFPSLPNSAATAEKLIAPELTLAFVLPFPSNFLADEQSPSCNGRMDGETDPREKGEIGPGSQLWTDKTEFHSTLRECVVHLIDVADSELGIEFDIKIALNVPKPDYYKKK